MNVNSKGVFPCAQVAAQVMVKQANCVIVSMASESGLEGSEGQSVYAASKKRGQFPEPLVGKRVGQEKGVCSRCGAGILEATGLRALSYETVLTSAHGISIDELRVGYAKTSNTPMGRSRKLSEAANTAALLLSSRVSYTRGVTINVAIGKGERKRWLLNISLRVEVP